MTRVGTLRTVVGRAIVGALVIMLATLLTACGSNSASAPEGVQVIQVSADGVFAPSSPARAGVPIRLEFGPGSACTAAVTVAGRTPLEDLTDGGGTVDLPALEAGDYPLICQANMDMGTLQVR